MRSFGKFLAWTLVIVAVIGGILAFVDYLYETYAKHYISTQNDD